jgi:hypothetical protein
MKVLKWSGIILAIMFVALQFKQPERNNPAVNGAQTIEARAKLPSNVGAILQRACYDCHSNTTNWPWYSNVAPFSWVVSNHVNAGRKHLNFSLWATYNHRKMDGLLGEIAEVVKDSSMPLSSYTMLHPSAKLSDEDIKAICDWAEAENQRLASQTGTTRSEAAPQAAYRSSEKAFTNYESQEQYEMHGNFFLRFLPTLIFNNSLVDRFRFDRVTTSTAEIYSIFP